MYRPALLKNEKSFNQGDLEHHLELGVERKQT